MKSLYCCAVLTFIFAFIAIIASCPPGWRQSAVDENKCYLVNMSRMAWFDAETFCESATDGGHLTSISSAFEVYVIHQLIVGTPSVEPGDQFWIGANDFGVFGTFVWADGKPLTYSNWNQGQPDANYQCVSSEASSSSKWITASCSTENYFICDCFVSAQTTTDGPVNPSSSTVAVGTTTAPPSPTTSTMPTTIMTTIITTTMAPTTTMLITTTATRPNLLLPDCYDWLHVGQQTSSGIYPISGPGYSNVNVYCDMDTSGGGWTVFQSRVDNSLAFWNRTWMEYRTGFNNGVDRNAWLSLDILHVLSSKDSNVTMRIDLWGNRCQGGESVCDGPVDPNGYWFGEYRFLVDDSSTNYRIHLSRQITGNLSSGQDSDYVFYSNFQQFSTIDNDHSAAENCTTFNGHNYGAWWQNDCGYIFLNGQYDAPQWGNYGFTCLRQRANGNADYYINPIRSQMKMRPAIVVDTPSISSCTQMWIGANDIDQNGQFEWPDGKPFQYGNWEVGQPDVSNQCVSSQARTTGKWKTEPCGTKNCFICESYTLTATTTEHSMSTSDNSDTLCPSYMQIPFNTTHQIGSEFFCPNRIGQDICYSCCKSTNSVCCDDGSCMEYDPFCRYPESCCDAPYCGKQCCSSTHGKPCGPVCAPKQYYTCCNFTEGLMCAEPDICCHGAICCANHQHCCAESVICCGQGESCCQDKCCPVGYHCMGNGKCCPYGQTLTSSGTCYPVTQTCNYVTGGCCSAGTQCSDDGTMCCYNGQTGCGKTCCSPGYICCDGKCCPGEFGCVGIGCCPPIRSCGLDNCCEPGDDCCQDSPTHHCCPHGMTCCHDHCCPAHTHYCGPNFECCPAGTVACGDSCCKPNELCHNDGHNTDLCCDKSTGNNNHYCDQTGICCPGNLICNSAGQCINGRTNNLKWLGIMKNVIMSALNQFSIAKSAQRADLPPPPTHKVNPRSYACFNNTVIMNSTCDAFTCLEEIANCGTDGFIVKQRRLYCFDFNSLSSLFNTAGRNFLNCTARCVTADHVRMFDHGLKPCCESMELWAQSDGIRQRNVCMISCNFCSVYLSNTAACTALLDFMQPETSPSDFYHELCGF